MKRALKKMTKLTGMHSGLSGDVTCLSGDVSPYLSGDVSGLRGNVSGLSGDVSGISGDVNSCAITEQQRKAGVAINDLIEIDAAEKERE